MTFDRSLRIFSFSVNRFLWPRNEQDPISYALLSPPATKTNTFFSLSKLHGFNDGIYQTPIALNRIRSCMQLLAENWRVLVFAFERQNSESGLEGLLSWIGMLRAPRQASPARKQGTTQPQTVLHHDHLRSL